MEESKVKSKESGILKMSKKGVKKTKALTAEEESRRREAVKEALREKLELEKRALQIVERLLEDSVPEDFLIDCARFIAPANYKDTVEERSIAKLCGYPICPNKLGKIPTQQFKISTKTNKVYDITERKLYCSNFCYKASKQFEMQISKSPLWIRKHETPSEITLMKKGDSGSSGEEVPLSERRLQPEDVENPLSAPTEPPQRSGSRRRDPDGSEGSEDEQDFVSSVVSGEGGPRVHWGDLPRRNEGTTKAPNAAEAESEGRSESVEQEVNRTRTAEEEAAADLHLCSLSIREEAEPKHHHSFTESQDTGLAANNLDITQVGMSKKGAAGLRSLLKHGNQSFQKSLLESLQTTLREWVTAETQRFLYGVEPSMGKAELEVEEEELDEDDIPEDDGDTGGEAEPTAAAPDYKTLRREAQEMQLKVKEFYKGHAGVTEAAEPSAHVTPESREKEPLLPLVDSRAQHVIQKKICVDKLSSCLKNIVGPLGLTMNDISTDLDNLVRTFRFTNTNIIHKTPGWTLLAVALLHLLSAVSPLVGRSLQQDSSVQHLQALMEELQLKEEDLLSLVLTFRPQAS